MVCRSHYVDIWNCWYSVFYHGPMTVYLPLYVTNFVSQFFRLSSIRICLQSSHYEGCHYIFLCCEYQSLSMPNKACPKAQSFLVFKLFFHWFVNDTRGRAFRREILNIHTVWPRHYFHSTLSLIKARKIVMKSLLCNGLMLISVLKTSYCVIWWWKWFTLLLWPI